MTKISLLTVTIEGSHRSGKDSLRGALNDYYGKYSHRRIVYCRGAISNWAFASIFGRAEPCLSEALDSYFAGGDSYLVVLGCCESVLAEIQPAFEAKFAKREYSNLALEQLISQATNIAKSMYPDKVLVLPARSATPEQLACQVEQWLR